jgi:hypothetical protein
MRCRVITREFSSVSYIRIRYNENTLIALLCFYFNFLFKICLTCRRVGSWISRNCIFFPVGAKSVLMFGYRMMHNNKTKMKSAILRIGIRTMYLPVLSIILQSSDVLVLPTSFANTCIAERGRLVGYITEYFSSIYWSLRKLNISYDL